MNNAPERVHGFFGAAKAAEAVGDNNKTTAYVNAGAIMHRLAGAKIHQRC
jgi:hypothetical protein